VTAAGAGSERAGTAISIDDFDKVDIRVGTVVEAAPNEGARKPSYKLVVDFGPQIGRKRSSAQLVETYRPDELIGRQVAAVVNFPPRQVAKTMSEVLVLGFPDAQGNVVLVGIERPVPDGGRLY
jgi:tRNA-binding protein